ncbi:MAG: Ig-like domain-containing protein, partial [Acinetobacter sp.]
EQIAPIDEEGNLVGRKAGTTMITAYSKEPIAKDEKAKSVSIAVNVLQPVIDINPNVSDIELGNGRSSTLSYSILPDDASNNNVSWESSDTSIVVVNQGEITAKANGSAVVTCTSTDGSNISAHWNVTIYTPTSEIALTDKEMTVNTGETSSPISFVTKPDDALYTGVVWSSNDESIAVVDELGAVTGIKAGKTTITATSMDPVKSQARVVTASIKTNVCQLATGVILSEEQIRIPKKKRVALVPEVLPTDTTNSKLMWFSSDDSIASVSQSGVVAGKNVGTVIITCTTTDGTEKSSSCSVDVYIPVSSISVKNTKLATTVNTLYRITTRIKPNDATNSTISWTSSNKTVAVIDKNGIVTANRVGTATITGTAQDGSGKTISIKFTVEPKYAISFSRIRVKQNEWGDEDCLSIEVKSNQLSRTVKDFDFNVSLYNSVGTRTNGFNCTYPNVNIGPQKTKKTFSSWHWYDLTGIANAYRIDINVTHVKFSDGSTESITADLHTASFYDNR